MYFLVLYSIDFESMLIVCCFVICCKSKYLVDRVCEMDKF